MADETYVVPRDVLIAEALQAGVRLTPTQLRRWCDVGLIPSPRVRGLGRRKGVVALYPTLAVWQAIKLGQALTIRRNLDDAGWFLWVLGFPVTPFVRGMLLERFANQQRGLRAMVRALGTARYRKKVIEGATRAGVTGRRGLFKTLRPESIPIVLRMFAERQLGTLHEHTYSENDWRLLQEGTLTSFVPDALDDEMLPSVSEVEQGLNRRSREASLAQVIKAFKRTDDRTLCVLRNEAQGLVSEVVKAFASEPKLLSPDDFRDYFARAVVDNDGAAKRKTLLRTMGWTRPPLTKLEEWILEKR